MQSGVSVNSARSVCRAVVIKHVIQGGSMRRVRMCCTGNENRCAKHRECSARSVYRAAVVKTAVIRGGTMSRTRMCAALLAMETGVQSARSV